VDEVPMKLSFLAFIVLTAMAIAIFSTIGIWVVIRLAGVRVTEVCFFFGPKIVSFFGETLKIG
jgi:hypothetical protein